MVSDIETLALYGQQIRARLIYYQSKNRRGSLLPLQIRRYNTVNPFGVKSLDLLLGNMPVRNDLIKLLRYIHLNQRIIPELGVISQHKALLGGIQNRLL